MLASLVSYNFPIIISGNGMKQNISIYQHLSIELWIHTYSSWMELWGRKEKWEKKKPLVIIEFLNADTHTYTHLHCVFKSKFKWYCRMRNLYIALNELPPIENNVLMMMMMRAPTMYNTSQILDSSFFFFLFFFFLLHSRWIIPIEWITTNIEPNMVTMYTMMSIPCWRPFIKMLKWLKDAWQQCFTNAEENWFLFALCVCVCIWMYMFSNKTELWISSNSLRRDRFYTRFIQIYCIWHEFHFPFYSSIIFKCQLILYGPRNSVRDRQEKVC